MIMLSSALLLSTMDVHTTRWGVAARVLLAGFGIGQIGPSLTIIVQNAVEYRDLGVATAGFSFIRSLGGSVGSAAIGAVYAHRVDLLIPRYVGQENIDRLPDPAALRGRPSTIRNLPEPVRTAVRRAFADSVTGATRVVIPVLVVTLVVFSMIPKVPLRRTFDPPPIID